MTLVVVVTTLAAPASYESRSRMDPIMRYVGVVCVRVRVRVRVRGGGYVDVSLNRKKDIGYGTADSVRCLWDIFVAHSSTTVLPPNSFRVTILYHTLQILPYTSHRNYYHHITTPTSTIQVQAQRAGSRKGKEGSSDGCLETYSPIIRKCHGKLHVRKVVHQGCATSAIDGGMLCGWWSRRNSLTHSLTHALIPTEQKQKLDPQTLMRPDTSHESLAAENAIKNSSPSTYSSPPKHQHQHHQHTGELRKANSIPFAAHTVPTATTFDPNREDTFDTGMHRGKKGLPCG